MLCGNVGWWQVLFEIIAVSILTLLFGLLLDILVGDPDPNSPFASYYKIHPTVLMGNFIKALWSAISRTPVHNGKNSTESCSGS